MSSKEQISADNLVKLYCEAKNDYRNALNLEQTILNFGVSILALCTATGFILFGEMSSWVIFCFIIPFFLSLVKFIYLHQKHRSKTYKIYQKDVEVAIQKRYTGFPAFEIWKSKAVSKFVETRKGFYYAYMGILVTVPYLFIAVGFISFRPKEKLLYIAFAVILAIVILGDIVCLKYLKSIAQLLKK